MIGELKRKIQRKYGIRTKMQRIIFAGKHLQDLKNISDYNIGRKSTCHLVVRLRSDLKYISYDHPDYDFELRNFSRLEKERKKNIYVKKDGQKCLLFRDEVMPTGVYGPFAQILLYIDNIELLYNFISVNKIFYESIFEMIRLKIIEFKEIHHHILFAGDYNCINEHTFRKLIKIMKEDNKINLKEFRFCRYPKQHVVSATPIITESTLLDTTIERGFLDSFHYLVEKEDFLMNTNSSSSLNSCICSKNINRDRMIPSIAQHFKKGDYMDSYLFENLIKKEKWDSIFTILKNDDSLSTEFYSGLCNSKKMISYENFVYINDTLAKFKFLDVCYLIYDILPILDWRIIEIILLKSDQEEEEEQQITEKGKIIYSLDVLEYRPEFYKFALENEDKMIIKFYRPRLELYYACQNKDKKRISELLEGRRYDPKKDFHVIGKSKNIRGRFKFEMFDPEIVEYVLSFKKLNFYNLTFVHAVKKKKWKLVDLFLRKKCIIKNEIVSDIIYSELENKRESEAILIFNKHFDYGINVTQSNVIPKLFNISVLYNNEKMAKILLSKMKKQKSYIFSKEIFQKLISESMTEYSMNMVLVFLKIVMKHVKKSLLGELGILIQVIGHCIKKKNGVFSKIVMEKYKNIWKMEYFVRTIMLADVFITSGLLQEFLEENDIGEILINCHFFEEKCECKIDISKNPLYEVCAFKQDKTDPYSVKIPELVCYDCYKTLLL